jgi:hypothetical protein
MEISSRQKLKEVTKKILDTIHRKGVGWQVKSNALDLMTDSA